MYVDIHDILILLPENILVLFKVDLDEMSHHMKFWQQKTN